MLMQMLLAVLDVHGTSRPAHLGLRFPCRSPGEACAARVAPCACMALDASALTSSYNFCFSEFSPIFCQLFDVSQATSSLTANKRFFPPKNDFFTEWHAYKSQLCQPTTTTSKRVFMPTKATTLLLLCAYSAPPWQLPPTPRYGRVPRFHLCTPIAPDARRLR